MIGVLGGSYNVTALSRMLFNDFFEDVGYTLITTSDGEIIAYDGDLPIMRLNMAITSLNFMMIRHLF